jgi:hypothetical protein
MREAMRYVGETERHRDDHGENGRGDASHERNGRDAMSIEGR